MKYSEATKQLEGLGFYTEWSFGYYDVRQIDSESLVATINLATRGSIGTDYEGFTLLTFESQGALLDIIIALAKTHPVDREDTKYVIKLNDMLYFAGYNDVRVLSVLDDNPGAILYAKVYTNYTEAKMVADTLCGSVEVPDL